VVAAGDGEVAGLYVTMEAVDIFTLGWHPGTPGPLLPRKRTEPRIMETGARRGQRAHRPVAGGALAPQCTPVHHRPDHDARRRGTLCRVGHHRDPAELSDDVKAIELWPCGYQAPCRVNNCTARATVIARAADSIGRPITQYELCPAHAEQVVERERAKGREIVTRGYK
jgi:hypothetical protein